LVLVRGARREEQQALQTLGVVLTDEWELSREVLRRVGVPFSAILLGEGEAADTLEELQIAAKALRPYGAPVILVTSKVHARRVRLTWRRVAGSRSRGIVRTARQDPFDPGRWWKEKRFALAVVREYLGLLNYWAGFPIAARAPRAPSAVTEWLGRTRNLESHIHRTKVSWCPLRRKSGSGGWGKAKRLGS